MNKKIFVFGILFLMLLFSNVAMAVAPVLSNEFPSDDGTLWDLTTTTINVTLTDIDSDINWTIDTSPDIGNSSGFLGKNGSKTCTISGLLFSTTYTWTVNASDGNGTGYTNTSFTFTTRTAKLRENSELNLPEKAVVGVIGVVILIGFIYVVLKMKFEDEKTFAKLLIGLIVALALLTVIFQML